MTATENEPGTASEMLSLSRAAGALNVSPNTVRNMIRRGTLPAVRVLGKVLVGRGDVEKLLVPQPVEPTAVAKT